MDTTPLTDKAPSTFLPEAETRTAGTLECGVLGRVAVNHESNTQQIQEDIAIRQSLATVERMLKAHSKLPENIGFYLCADPTELGIPHELIEGMELRGYNNSGYRQRAEGNRLFEDALRGYDNSVLRFVIIGENTGEGAEQSITPLAFFDYFRADTHIPSEQNEYKDAASTFVRDEGLAEEPSIYVISKLVADPSRSKTTADLHRFAIAAVLNAVADTNPSGVFMETQAQPATRKMVRRSGNRHILGMKIVLDQDIQSDSIDDPGGNPSKMVLYIPHTLR